MIFAYSTSTSSSSFRRTLSWRIGAGRCAILGCFGIPRTPKDSGSFLKLGRAMQKNSSIKLSDREEGYYQAAEALNEYERNWTSCKAGVSETQPCRFKVFAETNDALYKAYPEDANTGAYVVLSSLALATVVCTDFAPWQFPLAEHARSLGAELFQKPLYGSNPAFIHYSLHAHDYPYAEIYEQGVKFAERYPKIVNGSVHSMHMPSHIYMRTGQFPEAASANEQSVTAADGFSMSGALKYSGGPVGSLSWNPANLVSGYGFAYNAGNLYHSLEYEAYEVLQSCNFPEAALETERMGVASFQALAMGGGRTIKQTDTDNKITNLGSAWFNSTTYHGWFYRMEARLYQEAALSSLLGGVGKAAYEGPGVGGSSSLASSLPLPLAWSGSTDYSNSYYAPQSEAGLWNAIGLASVFGGPGRVGELIEKALRQANWSDVQQALSEDDQISSDPWAAAGKAYPWEAGCGGSVPGMASSAACTVMMGQKRTAEVAEFYFHQNIT
mmetsp:Transcript_22188/g.71763  ORF Transcript_22188/g.71763 Transcript_22188/m.71763 type:complete len:498 (-) Transcript_22188:1356-2849(-)